MRKFCDINLKKIRSLTTVLAFILSLKSVSQSSNFYFTSFGGYEDDVGNCIIQSLDSGFTIVGVTSSFGAVQTDIYITRTDKIMQSKWQKTIGGFSSDVAKSVVELSDSSLIIAGYSNSFGNGGYDAYICKADKNGNLVWQKTYGGGDWDFAYSINKTLDNCLIICGETYSYGKGDKDGFIMKMNASGTIIWSKVYGGPKADGFKEIIPTNDGGYIATGTTMSYGDSLGDIWIAKFNNMGDSVFFMTHGGIKKDVGNSITIDKTGNYLIGGGSESFTSGKEDAYIIKLTSAYSLVWDRFFGIATQDEEIYSVKKSTSTYGSMMICYTTKEVSAFKKDAKALLLSDLGYYIDGGRVGSYEDEEVFSIANCFDNGYILSGYTQSFNALQTDIFVLKFDSLVNGTGQYLGLYKIEKEGFFFDVYPNPFKSKLTIKSPNDQKMEKIEIVDLNGQILYQKENSGSVEFEIDSDNVPSGIYILRIKTNSTTYIKKLVCNR
ncbi:MAG: T9SS type A sorting domain-containing protein [Chitinophagaceae bacterium]|nr:T9SS type A sorting domain-containing protein [Chitinophagaceae bacterium]